MINDPADIEWLYTGLSTGSGQEIVGLSKTDYETVRAALESDTRRAKRAEAEAAALRAELDAARAGQVQARCCYCNKPATMARTYYDRGFPSAREHLCAEHFEHHPWHGDEEARP